MFFDTHAHLNFEDFDEDREEVIRRSLKEGLSIINVGTNYQTSRKAVEIAESHKEGIYAAIGLHPLNREEGFDYKRYKEMAQSDKVVAIGEIGLDFYSERKNQKRILLEQIKLAQELNLAVVFHCRKAHNELIEIISDFNLQGVIHCFTGNIGQAEKYLAKGFYLGFNGIIYKLNLEKIIKRCPLERMLLETDAPYLTPPQAEKKRNEPKFLKYIGGKIAEIKEEKLEKIAESTSQNARKLFLKRN